MATNLVEYKTASYIDSPDRDVLTQLGCQTLFNVGEKAIRAWRKLDPPIPYVETSNSFRYPRKEVLRWFDNLANGPKVPQLD
jgi:hypothetical protein